jgi:flagellin-like protein
LVEDNPSILNDDRLEDERNMSKKFMSRSGEAPIIATIILMAITIFCMSITLSFVQANLARRGGENEFTLAKTFMKNIGFAIDDVAWHKGQMNTIQYSSQNAEIHIRKGLLHYKIEVLKNGVGQTYQELNETKDRYLSVLLYDVPQSRYSLDNTYFEEILPGHMTSIVQNSTTSPITRVFALQTAARVNEESYVSVAVAPLIRSVSFTVTNGEGVSSTYYRLYLVDLEQGALTTSNPRYLTVTGDGVEASLIPNIKSIRVTVLFIKDADGYDYNFFRFPSSVQEIDLGPQGAQVELYCAKVEVGFLE